MSINKPSYLTIENNATIPNDNITSYFLSLKNKLRLVIPSSKNNGSVKPKTEFSINLGANANAVAEIIAKELLMNFFDKKYAGKIVTVEIIIVVRRCMLT